jgi:beta-mannosidase
MPVAAALRACGRWSLNEAARNFDAQDWWYRLRFEAPESGAATPMVLGLDGLATLAQVWLNGHLLLESDNMFVAHACDVTPLLQLGVNELVMVFRSIDHQLGHRRARPRWRTPMVAHQQLRWFRSTLLGRTPGWSPPAAVVGPWRPVWLAQRSKANRVEARRDTLLQARVQGQAGVVFCRLAFCRLAEGLADSGPQGEGVPVLQLARKGRVVRQAMVAASSGAHWEAELRVDAADLWWPHTHGEPALYQASVHWPASDGAPAGKLALGALGFREIDICTEGDSFTVVVNGVPVFCRGAVWTPLDPVSLRSSAAQCQAAVAQARAAGMNMLRVAGTMVYEEDHFYDSCDALGVLVWQDFMFASMDYPTEHADFAASAMLEARQNLLRLHRHACLAVLCGNSEVEQQAAMGGAAPEAGQPTFFTETLARLCAEHAPGTAYWPSSAHGGAFAHQASAGTTSYYGVGAYLRPLEDARRTQLRFATECLAFANVPADSALARMPGGLACRASDASWKARSPRDLLAGWDFDDVRDHYLETLFQIDSRQLRHTDHERYLMLSRIATGEAMAASMAEWRRPGSDCGGALVLFLRDLWAGAGWGLLDDAGRPKACFHYLRRVQQPLALWLSDEGLNGLWIHLVNEHAHAQTLTLELNAWQNGEVLVAQAHKCLTLAGRSAQSLCSLSLLEHFMDLTQAYQFGPPVCDAVVVTLRQGQEVVARACHFPAGLGCSPDADLGLSAQLHPLDAQSAELSLVSKRFARAVHIDVAGYEPDDDYFHLPPLTPVRIMLRGHGAPAGAWVHAANALRAVPVQLVREQASQTPGNAAALPARGAPARAAAA